MPPCCPCCSTACPAGVAHTTLLPTPCLWHSLPWPCCSPASPEAPREPPTAFCSHTPPGSAQPLSSQPSLSPPESALPKRLPLLLISTHTHRHGVRVVHHSMYPTTAHSHGHSPPGHMAQQPLPLHTFSLTHSPSTAFRVPSCPRPHPLSHRGLRQSSTQGPAPASLPRI